MVLKCRSFLYSSAVTFIFAILGGIVTYIGMPRFQNAVQPPLSPPAFLFPIVWTMLFLLMSVSASIMYDSDDEIAPKSLFLYMIQLTLNFWWCVLFFGFQLYLTSFVWLVLLWAAVLVMTIMFTRINKLAGLLQIAYLVWLTFAAYLNFGVWLLNR